MPRERHFVDVEPSKDVPLPEGKRFLVHARLFGRRWWATEMAPDDGGPPIRLDHSLYRISVYYNGTTWSVDHIGLFVWVRDERGTLVAKLNPFSKRVQVGDLTYKLDQSGLRPKLLNASGNAMVTFIPSWKDADEHSGSFVLDSAADFGEQLPAVLVLLCVAIPMVPRGLLQG